MSKSKSLEKLLEQRTQLQARIDQTRNREAALEKSRDTRRMILAGAYVIRLAEYDMQKVGRELIAAGMLEQRDYALFGITTHDNDNTHPDSDIV